MILDIKNVTKDFKNKKVLKDISLDIKKGEIISILGRSGSGKSTFLNIIAGFEEADNGYMTLNDKTVFDEHTFIEPQQRKLGFVFQNYALFPHLNVFKNITFGIAHIKKSEHKKIVEDVLRLINLSAYENKYPHELSGGEQQRIALARVLVTKPEVILFDEAFSSIDTVLKASIQKELVQILRSNNTTAIFVTHDPKEAMAISDRIAFLEKGNILQYDTPKNIYNCPRTKSIASFFGKANFLEKEENIYCVRPEFCEIATDGNFKGKVTNSFFKGEYTELDVDFEYEGNKHKFTIFSETDFDIEDMISFNINLSQSVTVR